MSIQFQILGPLEVRIDGAAIAIGGPRQRALLAMLLLSANQVVSRDRLIDELLNAAPSGSADRMLRVQVSRLRRALEADGDEPRVIRRAPGYVLRVDAGELDLDLFEKLLAEGHRAFEDQSFEHASTVLREAEALWRGRPLADLEFEPFARIEIERLQELRLTAREERIDAELALGRHNMLIAELETLVDEHPLRERLRGQLMLALYRSGRQADALETYRSGQALLSDELALEPSPALRQLERSILLQEPALELPAPTPAAPPETTQPTEPEPRRGLLGSKRRRAGLAGLALAVIAAAALSVTLTLGSSPALSASADSAAEIDPGSGSLRWDQALPSGTHPGGIAVGRSAVWETDTANDRLLRIDPATHTVEPIPVGHGPTGVAVGDGEVWVVNQYDRTVLEINPQTLRPVGKFRVGNGAEAAAYGDGSLWVANVTDDTISRITPGRPVKRIPLTGEPAGIAVGREGVWVTNKSTGQLLLIAPGLNRVVWSPSIGADPAGIALGAGNVWVANTADGTVSRLDLATGKIRRIKVGQGPVGVAYGAGAAWVADSLDGTIARIDPHTNSPRLRPIGGAPSALGFGDNGVWSTVLPGRTTHLGGTLKIAVGPLEDAFGTSLDPAQWANFIQWTMLSMTNDGLVTYRRTGGQAGDSLVPDLATSLPSPTDHGRTYTFQLRRGIRYSSGAPVRPEDFRRELERVLLRDDWYGWSFYAGIVGAEACLKEPTPRRCTLARGITTDDRADTITFHLNAPDPDFLYELAFPWADAVPADTPNRDLHRSMPPATGPYMTKSITPSHGMGPSGFPLPFSTWTLVRNPRFHAWNNEAQPPGYPDRIVLREGEGPRQAVSRVERRSLDVFLAVPTGDLSGLKTRYAQLLHSEPVLGTYAVVLNTRRAPFNNLLVRRALNFAIDRSKIVAFAGGARAARPTCQILPPDLAGYQPYCPYTLHANTSGSWSAANLPRARALIHESGTEGMKVTVAMQTADTANPTTNVGPYLVRLLDQLGYRASLKVGWSKHFAGFRPRAQLRWFNWNSDYPGPSDFISPILTCSTFLPNGLNHSGFCQPAIDRAEARAQKLETASPGSGNEDWAKIDRRITDQAPWVPLYNPRLNVATSSRVGNYQYHPFFQLLPDQLWVR